MRVAYCLSGLMRTFEETARSHFDNIIEPNDCDIFLTTWDVAGHGKHNTFASEIFQQKIDRERIPLVYGERLKGFEVHDFQSIQATLPVVFYQGMVSMFWQVKQCDLLRKRYEQEHGFRYDVIIRSRPDIYFSTGLRIQTPDRLGSFLYVKGCDGHNMNDMFAFGVEPIMSHYAALFDELEQYDRLKGFYKSDPGSDIVCWPEQTLLFHIQRNGIPIAEVPIDFVAHRGGYDYES